MRTWNNPFYLKHWTSFWEYTEFTQAWQYSNLFNGTSYNVIAYNDYSAVSFSNLSIDLTSSCGYFSYP